MQHLPEGEVPAPIDMLQGVAISLADFNAPSNEAPFC